MNIEELDILIYKSDAKRLIDIIEKQQKEIEELKTINALQKYRIEVIDERELVSKAKIKAKIEELDDINSEFSQRVIKSKEVYLTEMVQNILKELLEKE